MTLATLKHYSFFLLIFPVQPAILFKQKKSVLFANETLGLNVDLPLRGECFAWNFAFIFKIAIWKHSLDFLKAGFTNEQFVID